MSHVHLTWLGLRPAMWLRLSPTYVPVLNMFGVRTGAGWHREKGSIKMVKAVTLSQDA